MRNTINYTVETDGRDKGKVFVLTEMSALKAEKWAMRAILALMRGGMELPEGYEFNGITALLGLAVKELLPNLQWGDAEPLIDELMTCVKFMPDPSRPNVVRNLFEGDIEEVKTYLELKLEVWKLHTDFFTAGEALK